MSSRRSKRAAVITIGPLIAVLAFWTWGRPRTDVATPGPSTSPAHVVRTYVRALDERDFAVSNALQPYGDSEHWWTPNAPTITNLRITSIRRVGPGSSFDIVGSSRWKQAVMVNTSAVFRHFSGMSDGSTGWSYFLVRSGDAEPWRIFDWGQG